MRIAWIALALAACSPEITPGTYLCGDEELCPEGQACDGLSNTCELPSAARPFECGDEIDEVEPNDAFQSAQAVGDLQCVSRVAEVHGCSRKDGSAEDWFSFAVPSCTSTVRATARVTFPLAYEPLVLELRDANGSTKATADVCASDDKHDGDSELCLDTAVTAGDYAIRVAGSGSADCDGACAYNRYTLTMQLVSP